MCLQVLKSLNEKHLVKLDLHVGLDYEAVAVSAVAVIEQQLKLLLVFDLPIAKIQIRF